MVAGYGPAIGAAFAKRFGAAGYSLALLSLAETMPETAAAGRGHACQLPEPAAPTHASLPQQTRSMSWYSTPSCTIHQLRVLKTLVTYSGGTSVPADLTKAGMTAKGYTVDLSDPAAVKAAISSAQRDLGPTSLLFWNPVGPSAPFQTATPAETISAFNTTVTGGWWRSGAAATVGELIWVACAICQAT